MITGSSEISYACDVREILDCSPELGNPSCLQTTSASLKSQKSSHTLPQELLKHTSTRPSSSVRPPTSLTSVLLQTRSEKHKPVHYQYVSSHDSLIHSDENLVSVPNPKPTPVRIAISITGSDIYIYVPDEIWGRDQWRSYLVQYSSSHRCLQCSPQYHHTRKILGCNLCQNLFSHAGRSSPHLHSLWAEQTF